MWMEVSVVVRRSPRIEFLPLFCSGVVRLARISAGSWRCIQSGRLMQFVKVRMKNCKPVAWLQVSRKEKGPAAPKDFVVGGWRQNGLVKLRSG